MEILKIRPRPKNLQSHSQFKNILRDINYLIALRLTKKNNQLNMKQIKEKEKINLLRNECIVYIYDARIDISNGSYETAKITLNNAETRINRYKNTNPEVQKDILNILDYIIDEIQKLRQEIDEKKVAPRSEYVYSEYSSDITN
jgi:uncharacterized phage infection (PIP) family protein YhgE